MAVGGTSSWAAPRYERSKKSESVILTSGKYLLPGCRQRDNTAADVWRLLGWLAWHCAQRGQPLRAGQGVTTGSCTGLLFAPEGSHVQAQLDGVGMVELYF